MDLLKHCLTLCNHRYGSSSCMCFCRSHVVLVASEDQVVFFEPHQVTLHTSIFMNSLVQVIVGFL